MTVQGASDMVIAMHPLLRDPWVAARVEAAVAPYVGRLSAGDLAWMRDQLAEVIASDPQAEKLARRARPLDKSGEVRRGALQEALVEAPVRANGASARARKR